MIKVPNFEIADWIEVKASKKYNEVNFYCDVLKKITNVKLAFENNKLIIQQITTKTRLLDTVE